MRFARIRAPAAPDNPFIALQESATRQIVAALDAWRDMRDVMSESLFLTVTAHRSCRRRSASIRPTRAGRACPGRTRFTTSGANVRIAEIRAKIAKGGIREAAVRALIYIAMPRAAVDERAFRAIRRCGLARSKATVN